MSLPSATFSSGSGASVIVAGSAGKVRNTNCVTGVSWGRAVRESEGVAGSAGTQNGWGKCGRAQCLSPRPPLDLPQVQLENDDKQFMNLSGRCVCGKPVSGFEMMVAGSTGIQNGWGGGMLPLSSGVSEMRRLRWKEKKNN